MKFEITVRGKDGQIKERRGKRRKLSAKGGVLTEEINPKTHHWRLQRKVWKKQIKKMK